MAPTASSRPSAQRTVAKAPTLVPGLPCSSALRVLRLMPARVARSATDQPRRMRAIRTRCPSWINWSVTIAGDSKALIQLAAMLLIAYYNGQCDRSSAWIERSNSNECERYAATGLVQNHLEWRPRPMRGGGRCY